MNLTSLLQVPHSGGLGGCITALHHSEDQLALALLGLSQKHAADHEIRFVARDLAGWSREHVRRIADAGRTHGWDLDPEPKQPNPVTALLKRTSADALGRRHPPALLLLADLKGVHLAAAGVSVDWEVLAQSAQAGELSDLVDLAAECHPQTLRQLQWANTQVKELAAQAVLTS